MMGSKARHRRAANPDWAAFYDRLRGSRLWLVIEGVAHDDFSDLTIFKSMADLGPDLAGCSARSTAPGRYTSSAPTSPPGSTTHYRSGPASCCAENPRGSQRSNSKGVGVRRSP